MTVNGKLKSEQLRDELIRVDAMLAACKQDEVEALAEVKSLARAAIQPDAKDALAKIRAAEGRLGQHRMAERRLHDARGQIESDLAAAIAEENRQAREADAKAAEIFSEGLPDTFRECDRTFAEFRRAFRAAIDAVNHGRARGWNLPSQELFQSKLIRALRTWLSVADLRMLDLPALPAPERCSFASLGESYGLAIKGGARHSVKPPAPPVPLPTPTPVARSDDRRLPKYVDIGVRLPDDGPDFEARIPTGRS
jgi:hypothetical protein